MWFLLGFVAAHADELAIDDGTWELGGRATANIVIDNGYTDLYLDLSPTVGYFVADRTELLGGISMYVNEGALGVGFFVGLDYFLSNNGVAPYLGGSVGYGTASYSIGPFDIDRGDVVTIAGRGGLVVPLNRKVGIDLGARLNFNVEDGATWLHIPLGYLGVRAFFP
jgi:hypothetical protein